MSILQEDSHAVGYPKSFLVLDNSDIDAMLQIIYEERGLSLRFLSDYRSDGKNSGCAIVNYACMPTERLPAALETLAELL